MNAQVLVRRLCEDARDRAALTGTGVTVLGDGDGLAGHKGLVHGTDEVVHRLENTQVIVGEGPCLEAHRSGLPVEVDDVAASGGARWPLLHAEARRAGVAAVFCYPVRAGAVALGALFGYRGRPGPLTTRARTDLADLADRIGMEVSLTVARWAVRDDPAGAPPLAGQYVPVHTAAGMLAERWRIPVDDALVRIRAEAMSRHCSVLDVARAVLDRQLVLERD